MLCVRRFCRPSRSLPDSPPTALTEIASAVEEAVFQKDDIIVREGEPGNRMFIIGAGSVEVVKNLGRSQETVLAVLLPEGFSGRDVHHRLCRSVRFGSSN